MEMQIPKKLFPKCDTKVSPRVKLFLSSKKDMTLARKVRTIFSHYKKDLWTNCLSKQSISLGFFCVKNILDHEKLLLLKIKWHYTTYLSNLSKGFFCMRKIPYRTTFLASVIYLNFYQHISLHIAPTIFLSDTYRWEYFFG